MSTVALIAAPSAQRPARKRATASRMVFGRQGFERYPSYPASRARSSSPRRANAVSDDRDIGRLRVRLEPAGERQGGPAVVRLEGLVALAGQDLDHLAEVPHAEQHGPAGEREEPIGGGD